MENLKKAVFAGVFTILALAAMQFNFSPLLGVQNQAFTLFQFLGPLPGAFLGPVLGVVTVLAAQLVDFLVVGKEASWINVFRLAPMLLAAWYFGAKGGKSVVVAIAAMVAFWLHPVGQQAWFYAFYWLIPVIAAFYSSNLLLRSLGATFTAHAVGSVLFLYSIPTTAALWTGLIPVVAYERLMFAGGIAVSFVAFTTLLDAVEARAKTGVLAVERKYVLRLPAIG